MKKLTVIFLVAALCLTITAVFWPNIVGYWEQIGAGRGDTAVSEAAPPETPAAPGTTDGDEPPAQGEPYQQGLPEPWSTFYTLWDYAQEYDLVFLHMAGFTAGEWENIEDIAVDEFGRPVVERLMWFYQVRYSSEIDALINSGEMEFDESLREENFISAAEVEGFLISRFGVSRELLRTSERFNPQREAYLIPYIDGLGGGSMPYLTSAARSGDYTTLIFYFLEFETMGYGPIYSFGPGGEFVLTNWETKWELLIRHEGDSFRYVSNRQLEVLA